MRVLTCHLTAPSVTLTYKLRATRHDCVQEELERLRDFCNTLESLEGNLELWQQRLQTVAQAAEQVRRQERGERMPLVLQPDECNCRWVLNADTSCHHMFTVRPPGAERPVC